MRKDSNTKASPDRPVKVALFTNMPAPYRLPVCEIVSKAPGILLRVYYCSGREPDREWRLTGGSFERVYLRERFIHAPSRVIHLNPGVWRELSKFAPDVVITGGYNPTHLMGFLFAWLKGGRHIAMTDGTLFTETGLLSVAHRLVRRFVLARTHAFIGASDGSRDLFESYGVSSEVFFKSHLCADNEAYKRASSAPKRFDFIYCGRFVGAKNPLFALDVAWGVAKRLGRKVSIVLVGSGELETEMREWVARMGGDVDATFVGFAQQDQLPTWYGVARILLFPTSIDTWGVVANEACAAGLPVIVTPYAGVAGELVKDGVNGHVLPLDEGLWIEAASQLLSDGALYARLSAQSLKMIGDYTFENSAQGIIDAVALSMGKARA